MSADVARGDGKDYSTFHIIDATEGEVVAEYKGKVAPDKFGDMLNEFALMFNKALLCPENNSFGYATIVRLKDLNYPRMYYNKSKSPVYIGGYIPPEETELAGFTTSGKSRSLILTKLEEVIRNKRLLIYSSRFYEELKTFVWQENKAQAMKGENDDLVMSLAIGNWLFDSSSDYSRDSDKLNSAMLAAMGHRSREFNGASADILSNRHTADQNRDRMLRGKPRPAHVPPEFAWILKN
jgi:hypothetical protein